MDVLLKTKLYTPPVSAWFVPRPRLTGRLEEGLACKLILISAPAGFGKTALLGEWIGKCGYPYAWLSLDEGDNDPIRFLSYVIAALQSIDPDLVRGLTVQMGGPDLPSMQAMLPVLINNLASKTEPILLVLDDYQAIHNPVIHETLGSLLDHHPPALHLVIITRQDPPFSLARLRARAEVLEIRSDDLRFSEDETSQFLKSRLDLTPDEAVVSALHSRSEGWIAGLQLASLALLGRAAKQTDMADLVDRFTGSHPYVLDYLLDEVLRQQPERTRIFLQQTAILERLNASLCDEVTGRQDSQDVLSGLKRAELFLVSLDDEGEWYRYDQLFAEFLRTQIPPEGHKVFHIRAAHWLSSHGYWHEAIRHSLAAGEMDQAATWIGQASQDVFRSGEFVTLFGWMDALPDELVQQDSRLVTLKAWTLFLTGRYDEGVALVEAINRKLSSAESRPSEQDPISLGRLRLLQAYMQRLDTGTVSVPFVRRAVELLGEDDGLFSLIAMIMLANEQTLDEPSTAIRTFHRVIRMAQRQSNPLVEIAALTDLLAILDMQGRRQEAFAMAEDFLARNSDSQDNHMLCTGPILLQAGWLAYLADDLQTAEEKITRGVDYCRRLSLSTVVPQGLRLLAAVFAASGNNEGAFEKVREAHCCAIAAHDELIKAVCAATEADIYLKVGQIQSALLRIETLEEIPWPSSNPYYAPAYFTLIRLQIVKNQIQEAQSHLEMLSAWAEKLGHLGLLVSIRILQVQNAIARRDQPAARGYLEQAIRYASPQDYRRPFLDADVAVIDLLPATRTAGPQFIDSLLASRLQAKPSPALLDPLTERELEVLRLIADDLTNGQIAARLVTAVSTVKKHINHIFSKLQARDRTQAVTRARELGLL